MWLVTDQDGLRTNMDFYILSAPVYENNSDTQRHLDHASTLKHARM